MTLKFSKYQGTGNDFILVDNREKTFPVSEELVTKLCDRRFGIGSDGLMLIENHPELDYKMIFFNPDGSKSLCGNGSRCGFAFAKRLGIVTESAQFETTDGIHEALADSQEVHFSLFNVGLPEKIDDDFYINTGSPHYVRIVEDIDKVDVIEEGRQIRYSERFSRQNGTNVNFAQLLQGSVKVRTYERGVENETLSCGTGVTAVGLVASTLGLDSPIRIHTSGGDLTVKFDKLNDGFENIWLTGPAVHVFDGSIEI